MLGFLSPPSQDAADIADAFGLDEADLIALNTVLSRKRRKASAEQADRKRRVCAALLSAERREGAIVRNPNVHRDRNRVLAKVREMREHIFVRHYRLCREDFYDLLRVV